MTPQTERQAAKKEGELQVLDAALAALRRTTGIAGEHRPARGGTDAIVKLKTPAGAIIFAAQIKNVDRIAALGAVKHRPAQNTQPPLLVAPYVTAELADQCREKLDLCFIDTAGNAYLRAKGLYVFTKGAKPQLAAPETARLREGATAAVLRVTFALLCKPSLLNVPYRNIAKEAGVALGAVTGAIHHLARRGFLLKGKATRQLVELPRLYDEWAAQYPFRLRPKLHPQRFRAPDPDWWRHATLTRGRAWWGGDIAADRLTQHLRPARFTVYVEPEARRELVAHLVRTHQLRAAPAGDVEILDAFWNFALDDEYQGAVPPLLAYADLLAELEPRAFEAATLIRRKYLTDAPGPR